MTEAPVIKLEIDGKVRKPLMVALKTSDKEGRVNTTRSLSHKKLLILVIESEPDDEKTIAKYNLVEKLVDKGCEIKANVQQDVVLPVGKRKKLVAKGEWERQRIAGDKQ